jgi:hypothetical protein
MAQPLPFTLTNESITVIFEGKSHVVQKGAPQYKALRTAIIDEDWDAVPRNLTVAKSISDWAKGKFTLNENVFCFEGRELPVNLNRRILDMAARGEDPQRLFSFWERLQRNPSMRSVSQLWSFLEHAGIPLTEHGTFLAYKGVRDDYKDAHTGTLSNKPGMVQRLPRNQISDDPNHACHEGLHVGTLGYAQGFSQRVVVCEIDPEHVVCVPYDQDAQKMRVCEYRVVGNHNGELLPSTVWQDEAATVPARSYEFEEYAGNEDCDDCDECGARIPVGDHSDGERYHHPDCGEYVSGDTLKVAAGNAKKLTKKLAKKKAHKARKKTGKKIAVLVSRLSSVDTDDLMAESIDALRTYATQGLKIVGASKIPGGKAALVSAIYKARRT